MDFLGNFIDSFFMVYHMSLYSLSMRLRYFQRRGSLSMTKKDYIDFNRYNTLRVRASRFGNSMCNYF